MPIVVPGLSTGSSHLWCGKCVLNICRRTQCAIILRPSQQRHEVGVNAVRTWSKTRTKKNIKNREDGEAQGELLHDLPEWLEEFADSSVDGEVSTVREAHASSSPKPPPKVVSGRHTTYIRTSRKTEIAKCMQKNQNYEGHLQKAHR